MSRNDFGVSQREQARKAGGGNAAAEGRPARAPMPMKTANFGGLPGKTQPKDRSGGVKPVKGYPQREGL